MEQLDILLIDDEKRRMRATIEMLTNDGFNVKQIVSPSNALRTLRQSSVVCKVVILDIMIPPDGEFDVPESQYGLRTGFLLLDKLQTVDGFNTPVIVLTANASFEEELQGKVKAFLVKPVPYENLKKAIRKALKPNGGGNDAGKE
jgi:CheY-like chemotaxis protein